MRFSVLLSLGLASSVIAAPAKPFLSGRDPLSLHRRSLQRVASSVLDILTTSTSDLSAKLAHLIPSVTGVGAELPARIGAAVLEEDDDDEEYFESYEAEVLAWEDRHATCAEVCRVRTIEGAKSGLEALCSLDGLQSTLACAQCIDNTWPEDAWESTAMAEYDRIVQTCEAPAEEFSQLPL